jgi:hypothetical protein
MMVLLHLNAQSYKKAIEDVAFLVACMRFSLIVAHPV